MRTPRATHEQPTGGGIHTGPVHPLDAPEASAARAIGTIPRAAWPPVPPRKGPSSLRERTARSTRVVPVDAPW
jgi:hypothetical protein